jgi:M61 glycyl aminopeptidase
MSNRILSTRLFRGVSIVLGVGWLFASDGYIQECQTGHALTPSEHGKRIADPPDNPPVFDVLLRPIRGGAPEVKAIEVRAELRDSPARGKAFSLQAAITYASIAGIAERIQKLEVRDASGVVPLSVEDDRANRGGMPYFRHWRAGRDVAYPVFITYRSLPQSTPGVPGPQFSFRAHAGGVSAAGCGFLALPEDSGTFLTQFRWDLSELDRGATAASSFGEGDFEFRGPLWGLTQGYYMAGPLGRRPSGRGTAFVGYWLGKPPFDPETEMAWASKCYAGQGQYFRDVKPPTYRMFVRTLPDSPRYMGGTALGASFMLAMGARQDQLVGDAPRETIAHEMMHMFVGSSEGKHAGPWYNEGLTEYYTHLLLLRTGLVSVEAYARVVNHSVANYYSNPYRNHSAAALAELGFSAGGVGAASAQNVAYTRGRLYFATVDAKIRAASGGRRKLDDVILPLLKERARRQESGTPGVDVPTLVAALEIEYGPDARADFESVIVRGETIVPPANAFGPGFERRAKKYRVNEKDAYGYEWVRDPSIPDDQVRKW